MPLQGWLPLLAAPVATHTGRGTGAATVRPPALSHQWITGCPSTGWHATAPLLPAYLISAKRAAEGAAFPVTCILAWRTPVALGPVGIRLLRLWLLGFRLLGLRLC